LDRIIVVKANGSNVLTWLHDWCYEKLVTDPYSRFNPRSLLEDFLGDKHIMGVFREELKKKLPEHHSVALSNLDNASLRKQIVEDVTLIGEFSDLGLSEKSLKLRADAQYSLKFSSGNALIFQEHAQVFLFKVHRVGKHRAQVQVTCDVPEVEWILDDLWQDITATFEVIGKTNDLPASMPEGPKNSDRPNIEHRKQKGRYRLTEEEVKFRRQKVKEANKIKKVDPQKSWKEIDKAFADELNISERTFRSWRHNNY
jgi:hypothetical protein